MRDALNDQIESSGDEPLRAIKPLPTDKSYVDPILASALSVAGSGDAWVDQDIVREVFDREINSRGEAVALRETVNFVSVWQNYRSQANTLHTDLLPDGHPRSSKYKDRSEVALYMSTQIPKTVDPGTRSSIVKAVRADSWSVERQYHAAIVASAAPQLMYIIDDADRLFENDFDYYDPQEEEAVLQMLESIDDESED